MVTAENERRYDYRGLSTDTKPINGVGNGSVFFEMDTEKVFMFDFENKQWIELE